MSFRIASCLWLLLSNPIVGVLPTSDVALEIRLKDGGTRTGVFDVATNEASLRIRVGEPDAYIIYGIDWDKIEEVRDGTERWSADRFAEFRAKKSDPAEVIRAAKSWHDVKGEPSSKPSPSSRPLWESPSNRETTEAGDSRVRYIEIDAVTANWDSDAQWDGIVLRVWPMNQWGEVIPVSGILDVTLSGDRGDPPHFDRHGDRIQSIDHWVRWLRESHYGNDGANVRLEFQAFRPEPRNFAGTDRWHVFQADPGWWLRNNSGDVFVRMTVPGHGVFEASVSLPVRLRRFSPLRDRYFIRNGTRSFPAE